MNLRAFGRGSAPSIFSARTPSPLRVLSLRRAPRLVAFWFYDFFLPGSPHPHIGLLIFLVLPGLFLACC